MCLVRCRCCCQYARAGGTALPARSYVLPAAPLLALDAAACAHMLPRTRVRAAAVTGSAFDDPNVPQDEGIIGTFRDQATGIGRAQELIMDSYGMDLFDRDAVYADGDQGTFEEPICILSHTNFRIVGIAEPVRGRRRCAAVLCARVVAAGWCAAAAARAACGGVLCRLFLRAWGVRRITRLPWRGGNAPCTTMACRSARRACWPLPCCAAGQPLTFPSVLSRCHGATRPPRRRTLRFGGSPLWTATRRSTQ